MNRRKESLRSKAACLRLEILEDRNLLSFLAPVNYNVELGPSFIAVSDLNGDGTPDIVTANDGANSLSVLLANGDGSFQPATSYPVGTYPRNILVADFNHRRTKHSDRLTRARR